MSNAALVLAFTDFNFERKDISASKLKPKEILPSTQALQLC